MTVELRPQPGAQERALNSTADITIYGGAAGSGKTHLMMLRAAMGISDPNYAAVFFRRTGPEMTGPGSLWEEAKKMYAPWSPRVREMERTMVFKNGAFLKFSHMEHVHNKLQHQGKQYSEVFFDEGTHFEEEQVTYLGSRLRSSAEGRSSMFISCNPDPDSFLADWIEWWLDEDGFPDKSKSGHVKFYVVVDGSPVLADTEQELIDEFPGSLWIDDGNDGTIYVPPKTMTFIGGTIHDNPAVLRINPGYLAELNSLPGVDRDRLLFGNWYARPEGSSYFQRSWLQKVNKIPSKIVSCRAWDKASTEPSETNAFPDYTACIKMAKDIDGFFYLIGEFHEDNFDRHDKKKTKARGRFRERPGTRDNLILKQSQQDGTDCTVIFSVDPGQAGVTEFQETSKKLMVEGHIVRKDPMPSNNSKLTRFVPFSAASENGFVYIVENTFNKATLDAFYKELEAFDGEKSSKTRKDDWPDCTASAFNFLSRKAVIPSFTLADFKRTDPFEH